MKRSKDRYAVYLVMTDGKVKLVDTKNNKDIAIKLGKITGFTIDLFTGEVLKNDNN